MKAPKFVISIQHKFVSFYLTLHVMYLKNDPEGQYWVTVKGWGIEKKGEGEEKRLEGLDIQKDVYWSRGKGDFTFVKIYSCFGKVLPLISWDLTMQLLSKRLHSFNKYSFLYNISESEEHMLFRIRHVMLYINGYDSMICTYTLYERKRKGVGSGMVLFLIVGHWPEIRPQNSKEVN